MSMSSNRPYLIRAFYEWILDNDCTPYVVVDAYYQGVEVPQQFVNDGQIVLNLAPRAVTGLQLDNTEITFNTRFGGVPTDIYLPVKAVLGIYARENGQGMVFQPEPGEKGEKENSKAAETEKKPLSPVSSVTEDDGDDTPPSGGSSPNRPSLRVVK
ncbi:ClpXP protease specificity-enhancing factor [Porticoccaceae bacterium LTM1]|nr:ClpXP protease specificity-enhancing factor [Porticoccaceae bacterium LTM1]